MPSAKSQRLAIYRDAAILAGVLLLYGALSWYICNASGPFGGDPDYQYLLSGLDILVGKAPNYYDHPGTPVQSLIALGALTTWLLTWPFHHTQDVIDDVLARPEFYLSSICGIFGAAIAAAMGFFVWSFRATQGSMAAALVGLFSIFTSAAVYVSFHHVMPEPLLLEGTFLLAGLILYEANLRDSKSDTRGIAIAVGITAAFCVTAKVTAAPVLLTLFFLKPGRNIKSGFLAFAASCIFFVLPILRRLHGMERGYVHILTHQGDYGTGSAGPPPLSTIWKSIVTLEQLAPEIFLSLGVFVLALAGTRMVGRQIPKSLERILLLCTGVILFSILLVSKQPRAYYLIPALAFMALGNAVITHLVLKRLRLAPLFAAAIIAIFCYMAFAPQVGEANRQGTDWQTDKALISRAQQSGCLVVSYYIVKLPEWDLYFGNLYTSGNEFTPLLERRYPNFVTYNGGPGRFETFSGILSPTQAVQRFAREKCVYMIGIPWQAQFGISPAALDLVAQSHGGLALYSLRPGWEKLK